MDRANSYIAPRVSTDVRLPSEGSPEEGCEPLHNVGVPPNPVREGKRPGRARYEAGPGGGQREG